MPYYTAMSILKWKSNMAASFKMAALFPQNLNIFGYNSNTIAWISMKLYLTMPYCTAMSTLKRKSNMAASFKDGGTFSAKFEHFQLLLEYY